MSAAISAPTRSGRASGLSVDRLTALDRLMLGASRTWPQDIGALAILDGRPLLDGKGRLQIARVREAVERRLHLVNRFRQIIVVPRRGLGGPVWVDAPTVDLSRHVRELALESPAGEARMAAAVERLLRQRLDPARPLWELWFLTGLPDGRVGLFVRIHHAIGDGIAAMTAMAALLDPVQDVLPMPTPRWEPRPWPSAGALIADNLLCRLRGLAGSLRLLSRPREALHRVRAAWPAIRELIAEEPATATSLDRMVGPDRRLALIRGRLDVIRRAGRAHGATVNDVLLAATAGGLCSLLRSRGEPVDGTTLRIYVPVSLRRRLRGPQQGNLIAQMAVPLHLGEADPVRRLRQIAGETAERKARTRTNLGSLMIGGGIGRRLLLMAVMRQRVNATSASIPGPRVPLYLAGARVLEIFPVLPLVANEPLAIGALSYAGALAVGIAADPDVYPDLDVFATAVQGELEALAPSSIVAPIAPGHVTEAPETVAAYASRRSESRSRPCSPGSTRTSRRAHRPTPLVRESPSLERGEKQ